MDVFNIIVLCCVIVMWIRVLYAVAQYAGIHIPIASNIKKKKDEELRKRKAMEELEYLFNKHANNIMIKQKYVRMNYNTFVQYAELKGLNISTKNVVSDHCGYYSIHVGDIEDAYELVNMSLLDFFYFDNQDEMYTKCSTYKNTPVAYKDFYIVPETLNDLIEMNKLWIINQHKYVEDQDKVNKVTNDMTDILFEKGRNNELY